jgi:hypothetical protein
VHPWLGTSGPDGDLAATGADAARDLHLAGRAVEWTPAHTPAAHCGDPRPHPLARIRPILPIFLPSWHHPRTTARDMEVLAALSCTCGGARPSSGDEPGDPPSAPGPGDDRLRSART